MQYVNETETNHMKPGRINAQRRDFLKIGSLAAAAIAISSRVGTPARAAAPHLDEKDAMAQGLGYKNDAAGVDKVKFAKYKAGETCANCQLYQGKAGEAWGGCSIFAGKAVSSKGWCAAWAKKA